MLVELHALQEVDAGMDMLVHNLVDIDEVDYLAIVGNEILDEGAALERAAELESLGGVEEFDGENAFGVLCDAVGLGGGIAAHTDEVFLVLAAGYAVDAAGCAELFGLAGDGGRGVLGDHEAAVEAGLSDEEAWEAAFGVDELVGASFADAAEFGEGDGEEVEGHGEGFAVEVAAGDDEVVVGEDDGVVGGGVDLGLDDGGDVGDGVLGCAVDLGCAAEAVGVLDMVFVAGDDLAALGVVAYGFGGQELAFVGTDEVEGLEEGLDTAVEGVEAEAEDDVGLGAEALCLEDGPDGVGAHELCAVEKGEPFFALEGDGLPTFLGIDFLYVAATTFVVDVAQAEDGGEHEVGEWAEVAAGAEASLLIDDGEDVVVEAVDKPLCGDELDAAVAEGEVLDFEEEHEFDDFQGDFVADATGVAHDEVFLQLAELFAADGDIAEGAESGGDAIDGLFLGLHLLVEIVTAFIDTGDGVVAEGDGHLIVDDFLHPGKGESFGGYVMCHN